ncbi:Gfo/Idh/MocA family oxidoreductase [uncultured Metabacillus sp.]|uniref:Gfo/Idh/MocA family protein n=1 Tax=uncultured Metabacillus sp. TaxID=2860135 RepID=UPI00261233B8|nr:Gfo/Idh/MocA family oxidoreductase [uncultured Metabacillus sp.]
MKIGVVGTGTMGKLHLEAWSKMKTVKIGGIAGRNHRVVEQLSETYKTNGYTDYEGLLKSDVDVIDICLPTYLHSEFIRKAAKSGKHIICEKPLALDGKECKELYDVCKTYNVQLLVGHTLRFYPEYQHAREQVKNGAIGNPGVVRLSRGGPYPKGRDAWYMDEAKSGGVLLDLGIHDFDWLRWTFGEVERVMAKQMKRESEDGTPIEHAFVTLRMQSGTIVHLELSWAKKAFESSFEITGDKGMLTYNNLDSNPIKLSLSEDHSQNSFGVAVPESIGKRSPLQQQLQHFRECLISGEKTIISDEDVIKAVEVARAAIESARIGQPVSLLSKKEVV